MLRDELLRSDGSSVGSLGSLTYSCTVSAREDLHPGSACAAMVEATVFAPTAPVEQGAALKYYRGGTLMGIFYCEKPQRTGTNQFRLTGYDAMIRFDRNVGAFLQTLSWPRTVRSLLRDLCGHCGVPLESGTTLPGGDMEIDAPGFSSVTGRQLLDWIGQAAGRYFAISPAGYLRGAWYGGEPTSLGSGKTLLQLADGVLTDRYRRCFALRNALPYRLGGLRHSDFTTAPVERVLIRSNEADAGTVWPDGSDAEANTLILQGNPLLLPRQGTDLQAVAKRLYEQFQTCSYTPFTCELMPGDLLLPGSLVTFHDAEGGSHTAPIMEMTLRSGRCTIGATGNPSLQSTTAFNSLSVGQLMGRLLTVERSAQGLQVINSDVNGALAALKLGLEGISTRVSSVETDAEGHATVTQLSQLEQRADALELIFTKLKEEVEGKAGEGDVEEITQRFIFDETGLTITNSGTGMGIGISQERIVFTGGTNPTTQITPNEMATTNLRVGSRLDVGAFSLIPRTSGNLSLRYTGS